MDSTWSLTGQDIRVRLAGNGTIKALEIKQGSGWENVGFRDDLLAGPSWADVALHPATDSVAGFAGVADGMRHTLRYRLDGPRLAIDAGLKNETGSDYRPEAARLVLGVNSEMKSFPSWNDRYFPTLLRCEKTHFWGYLMTPKGRILTVGSPDPVASYHLHYAVLGNGDGGHLIHTFSLDLLHALPLPARHPQDLSSLKPGEERTWTVYLQTARSLDEVKPILAASLDTPMIEADRYTLARGETASIVIHGPSGAKATIAAPDGKASPLRVDKGSSATGLASFAPEAGPGLYTLTVTGPGGRRSEACIAVRHPWSWYMIQARRESLRHQQYASSHLEQWLGLASGILARRHLPDPSLDAQTDQRLHEILKLQWDLTNKVPSNIPHAYRLFPNTAQMAYLLACRYMADHDPYWADLASGFADYLVSRQHPDGNYVNYTSVAYPVKSVIAVMAAEAAAAATAKDARFKAAYASHEESARKAADFLVRMEDDLQTEGELTFEDGMISCSAMQLGLFALRQDAGEGRRAYAEASRKMLIAHRCLEQLLIPDARMNGATLRFWEAQYDVLMGKTMNMMNSPHGWSAWLIPGLWYQYLLTGEEEWLRRTMNALGACVQLIDSTTGELRWAFVPDPYRDVTMLEPDGVNPCRGKRVERVIGETYVPMIAEFHYPDTEPVSGNKWDCGWSCCNDVHEVFIALEEVALTSAYVIERANGHLAAWNCKAEERADGHIVVEPAESMVSRVHVNLRKPHQVMVNFATGSVDIVNAAGMQWIGPGGIPEWLQIPAGSGTVRNIRPGASVKNGS